MIFFAHPHILNPMVSYSYKKVGRWGPGRTRWDRLSVCLLSAPSPMPTVERRPLTSRCEGSLPSLATGSGSSQTGHRSLHLRSVPGACTDLVGALKSTCSIRTHPDERRGTRPMEASTFDFQLSSVDFPLTTHYPLLTLRPLRPLRPQHFFRSLPRRW